MYFCKHKLNFDISVNAGPAEHNSEYIDVDNILKMLTTRMKRVKLEACNLIWIIDCGSICVLFSYYL